MNITKEQLAELKAAFEKATKGEWRYRPDRFDDWGYIRGGGENGTVAISRAGEWYNADAHRSAKTDPFEPNGRFIALAHNLMPSLIAAAEEAERLRNTLQLHAGDVMSLSNEIDRMQAYARDEFAAGRKDGVEAAAAVFDKRADNLRAALPGFHPAGQSMAQVCNAIDQAKDDARTIRALIEKEPANV